MIRTYTIATDPGAASGAACGLGPEGDVFALLGWHRHKVRGLELYRLGKGDSPILAGVETRAIQCAAADHVRGAIGLLRMERTRLYHEEPVYNPRNPGAARALFRSIGHWEGRLSLDSSPVPWLDWLGWHEIPGNAGEKAIKARVIKLAAPVLGGWSPPAKVIEAASEAYLIACSVAGFRP